MKFFLIEYGKSIIKKYLTFLLVVFIFLGSTILCYSAQNKDDSKSTSSETTNDSLKANQENTFPWRNSIFLAAGYGYPQGLRAELGYNILNYLSLGITFGIFDYWSRDHEEGTFGLVGKLFVPVKSLCFTPYLLIGGGGTVAIFGGSDEYTLVYIGAMIPLLKWLQLRPECGLDFTSKHISGGSSLFGSSPEVREDITRFSINLSVEFDIFAIFRE